MQKNTTAKLTRPSTWPLWAGALAGLFLVCIGAVGLAYFWRVMFEFGDRVALLPLAACVAAVLALVYALFFVAHLWAKDRLCFKAALGVFIAGLLFVFASAPLQAPDEEAHYLRAYALSQGRFTYDYDRTYGGDVAWLFEATKTEAGLGHAVRYGEGELAPAVISAYLAGVESGTEAPPVGEPIMQTWLPFVPQALAMGVARLLGFGALGLLYAGRIGNLLAYALLCYFAFRNCQRYRGVFFALGLLPLSLFMAASCNYDGTMLAACYWMVSLFCKDEVRRRDVVVFGLCAAYATYIKPLNIVLAVVLLLVPKTRWKNKWHPWVATGVVVAGCLFAYFVLGRVVDNWLAFNVPEVLPRGGGTENVLPEAQMIFVLSNLPAFLARMAWSVYEEAAFLFKLGVLGKLDLDLPLVSGLSVLSLAAAAALGIQQKEDTRRGPALALGLGAALYAAAVLGGMYVLDSAYQSVRITGVQPRYFLPAILLVFMLCSILLGKAVRPRLAVGSAARTERITLYIALAVALFAAVALFQCYFIGQWLPKGEGGFKLVNLFGWQWY